MTFLRPEALATLARHRDTALGLVVLALGLWWVGRGGFVLVPLGLVVAALGAVLLRQGLARARFRAPAPAGAGAAPGIVELDEAQVGYLGPATGGFISLDEAIELRVMTLRGRRLWRVKQADGQVLLIPIEAEGADRLFDAFAALPGMDPAALARAARPPAPPIPLSDGTLPATADATMALVWHRPDPPGRLVPGRP